MFLSIDLPSHLNRTYQILRLILWVLAIFVGTNLFLQMLFPDFAYTFSFRTPNSSRNTLLDPRLSDGTARTNGKISPGETLTLNAGLSGDFSQASIGATLEGKSALTEHLDATLGRSYRAFLLPDGLPLTEISGEALFRVDQTYFALRDGVLVPFVSEAAYRSRYADSLAQEKPRDWLTSYPISDAFIGFRIGSLLSFADGVFIVVDETELRPVGSAEVFLALGYRFADVLPVSEEDIGIYHRGRIITLGFVHPSGTLFRDIDTGTTYVVEGSTKRAIENDEYLRFLEAKQSPILASSKSSQVSLPCTLIPGIFPRTLRCSLSIAELASIPGSDLTVTLSSPDQPIDMNTLTVTLETHKSLPNALRFGSIIKQRLLNNFGLGV